MEAETTSNSPNSAKGTLESDDQQQEPQQQDANPQAPAVLSGAHVGPGHSKPQLPCLRSGSKSILSSSEAERHAWLCQARMTLALQSLRLPAAPFGPMLGQPG